MKKARDPMAIAVLILAAGFVVISALALWSVTENRRTTAAVKRLVEQADQRDERTRKANAIAEVQRTAQLDAIQTVSENAAAAAGAASETVKILSECFQLKGTCGQLQKAQMQRQAAQLAGLEEQIKKNTATQLSQTRFIVTEIRKGVFEATPAPSPSATASPCQPAIGIGNVGVGTGVACVKP